MNDSNIAVTKTTEKDRERDCSVPFHSCMIIRIIPLLGNFFVRCSLVPKVINRRNIYIYETDEERPIYENEKEIRVDKNTVWCYSITTAEKWPSQKKKRLRKRERKCRNEQEIMHM